MENDAEKLTYVNMDSYVVHIYRRDRNHPEKIIGIVETVSTGKKEAFKSASALMAILTKPVD
jgi:hypothetical protein